ncbi:MAG: hypothetical protein EXX96DRAFT_605803 [Benjaminiella poitrasii]|nr:MAG: hypothetical protein EXX96DRAFT_605803 [Benjaminiella poitrasii]
MNHSSNFSTLSSKRDVLRVIVDQPRLYIEESLGSTLIRGEVVCNFSKDAFIQGPIELLFEGIQRFYPWPEIMNGALPLVSGTSVIETKFQTIKLSLLPPNSKGIMPAGIQRFPFEFPIPATLPISVEIPNRIEILYQLSAILRRSYVHLDSSIISSFNWIEKARNSNKKKYVACQALRIVRALESSISDSHTSATPSVVQTSTISQSDNTITTQQWLPWANDHNLDNYYQVTYDEQHDQLAFSLAGRTTGNLSQPLNVLDGVQGIRFKMSVDRTAIAIGTSVGIELMIEPTVADAVVKSIVIKISETCKYNIKIPSRYCAASETPLIKSATEGKKMILKWAYGYGLSDNKDKYIYVRDDASSSSLAYFDPPSPGAPGSKVFLPNMNQTVNSNSSSTFHASTTTAIFSPSLSVSDKQSQHGNKMVNLKELKQKIHVGEILAGRFVLPVPDCSNILNPSMKSESLTITHWLELVVTVTCQGKTFNLSLETPCRLLDCRLVDDDEQQTIFPAPPSYDNSTNSIHYKSNNNSFWEQREPITFVSGWGSCRPCPCQARKKQTISGNNYKYNEKNSSNASNRCQSSFNSPHLPEWGPPPCYSKN